MSKPVIIVNPRSGGGLGEARWAKLAAPIAENLGPFDVRFTEHAGHAVLLAAEEAERGRELVIALGGDGTINEVANGLLGVSAAQRSVLGIIPHGTGGDFCRTLDLPRDTAQAAARLRDAAVRTVDAGEVTLVGPDGDLVRRHFINVSSFGFSAAVADRANRSSKRFGAKTAFLGATVRTLLSYDNADVVVTIDGEPPARRRLLFGACGKGKYFGGGMKICPDARLDNGVFDVVLVGDLGRLDVVLKTNRLYDGTHLTMPEVSHRVAREIRIEPQDQNAVILVEVDGETPGRLPATFKVLPGALRLRA